MKSQFPNIQGLSTPILGQKFCLPCFQFASGYPYFQVLHCASLQHWIAISIDVNEVVSVYDSLFNGVRYDIKEQIASILRSNNKQIQLHIEMVQFQTNSVDCGLFAIAFITDLCYGIDPSNNLYKESKLHMHFLSCLQEGKMVPFPSERQKRQPPLLQSFNIYCRCWFPYAPEHSHKKSETTVNNDAGLDMIACDTCNEWFHLTCINVSAETLKSVSKPNVEWICEECAVFFEIFSEDDQ